MKHLNNTVVCFISTVLLISGCRNEPEEMPAETPRPTIKQAETIPVDVNDWNRFYSDSIKIRPGHWEKNGETFFEPTMESWEGNGVTIRAMRDSNDDMMFIYTDTQGIETEYRIVCRDMQDRYSAGGECRPRLSVIETAAGSRTEHTVYGSLYLADISEGNDVFGQNAAVREYFVNQNGHEKTWSSFIQFGTLPGQGREGAAETSENGVDYYFKPAVSFPEMVSEGDTISAVLEVMDAYSGTVKMRNVWTYIWIEDLPSEESEPEERDHSDAGWTSETYSGHWDLTDVIYTDESVDFQPVRAERKGADGQTIVYTILSEGGDSMSITIPPLDLEKRYYAGSSFDEKIEIFCSSNEELLSSITCSAALYDIEFDGHGKASILTPRYYFYDGRPDNIIREFGPLPHNESMSWRNDISRGLLYLQGDMPEGSEDGEKLYFVFSVKDQESGLQIMRNIYEYQWHAGPEEVWTYTEPGY